MVLHFMLIWWSWPSYYKTHDYTTWKLQKYLWKIVMIYYSLFKISLFLFLIRFSLIRMSFHSTSFRFSLVKTWCIRYAYGTHANTEKEWEDRRRVHGMWKIPNGALFMEMNNTIETSWVKPVSWQKRKWWRPDQTRLKHGDTIKKLAVTWPRWSGSKWTKNFCRIGLYMIHIERLEYDRLPMFLNTTRTSKHPTKQAISTWVNLTMHVLVIL